MENKQQTLEKLKVLLFSNDDTGIELVKQILIGNQIKTSELIKHCFGQVKATDLHFRNLEGKPKERKCRFEWKNISILVRKESITKHPNGNRPFKVAVTHFLERDKMPKDHFLTQTSRGRFVWSKRLIWETQRFDSILEIAAMLPRWQQKSTDWIKNNLFVDVDEQYRKPTKY